jgi:RNA 2',3'-cyclic 3'-phosphodiesterase
LVEQKGNKTMQRDPRQLSLFIEPASLPMTKRERVHLRPHKVFFGIRPPGAIAPAIAQLGTALATQYGGAPLQPDKLHVSLNGVGAYATVPDDIIDRANTIFASVTAAPFDVAFDRLLSWGRGQNRYTVLRCTTGEQELKALYAVICTAMTRGGLTLNKTFGIPHMTVFYGNAVLAEPRLPQPFAWRVDRFYLIYSIHGTGRHELRGEWPLRGTSTDPPNAPRLLF